MSRRVCLMGQLGMLCMLLMVRILLLFVTGCGPGETMSTGVDESTAENMITETTEEMATEEPITQTHEGAGREESQSNLIPLPQGAPLTDAELAEYQVYFGEYDTWYTQALTSFYESARMVDLKELFYMHLLQRCFRVCSPRLCHARSPRYL